MDRNETCYIELLHNNILANILACLPEPVNIMRSVLCLQAMASCHHHPCHQLPIPTTCSMWLFATFFASLLFTPIDQMASSDLVEMTNNLMNDLAESITDGPWDIANYHECLFLLICCQWCHTGRWTSCPILAIFNPLT
jgi:hypothetical protein